MEGVEDALSAFNLAGQGGNRISQVSDSRLTDHAQQHIGDAYHGNIFSGTSLNSASGNANEQADFNAPSPARSAPVETKGNEHWLVPRTPSTIFTGQESVLAEMRTCLLPDEGRLRCARYVLQGIGGVGKSELALQFAERHRSAFWGVFWVDFTSSNAAHRSFAQIAKMCQWSTGFEGNDETDGHLANSTQPLSAARRIAVEDVVNHLSNCAMPWLLILDNCDDNDPQYYSRYLPDGQRSSIIMTTRLPGAVRYGKSGYKCLTGLDSDSSLTLLATAALGDPTPALTGRQKAAAERITISLDHHALSITVAGSVIYEGLYSMEEYAQVIDQKMNELFEKKPEEAESTYGTINATFDITIQRLQESNEVSAKHAVELLGVLAHLDRVKVPEDLFVRAWAWSATKMKDKANAASSSDDDADFIITKLSAWHFETALAFSWAKSSDMLPFRAARSKLIKLALINWTPEETSEDRSELAPEQDSNERATTMHPVIHTWARDRLGESNRIAAWNVTAAILTLSAEGSRSWKSFTSSLQRHIEICFDKRPTQPVGSLSSLNQCRMLHALWFQLYCADHPRGLEFIEAIESMLPSSITDESETYLEISEWKAASLRKAEAYAASTELLSKVVSIREKTLQPEDAKLRNLRRALAESLGDIGKLWGAIEILESLEHIEKSMTGISELDRCDTLTALGTFCYESGRPWKSVKALEKAIDIFRRNLEEDHPRLVITRHHLACAYQEIGKTEQAIDILQDVVQIWRRYYISKGLYPLNSRLDLARVLQARADQDEEVHRLIAEHFAPEDSRLLITVPQLGIAYLAKGNSETSDDKAILDDLIRLSRLRSDNNLWSSQYQLGRAYLMNGQSQKAVDTLEEVFQIDSGRVMAKIELARAYKANAELSQAIRIITSMSNGKRRTIPADHGNADLFGLWMVDALICTGEAKEAKRSWDCLVQKRHTMSEENQTYLKDLLKALLELESITARKCFERERVVEAINFMERVVAAYTLLFGPEIHERHVVECNLIFYYTHNLQLKQGRQLLDQVSATAHLLPQEHQGYLMELAADLEFREVTHLYAEERLDAAIEKMERVVLARRQTLAPEHAGRYCAEYILIELYIKDSQFQKARELLEEVKATSTLLQEEDQVDLKKLATDLEYEEAKHHYAEDRLDAAIEKMERVVLARRQTLAPEHFERHYAEYKLITYYIDNSQCQKARDLLEEVKATSALLEKEDQDDLQEIEDELVVLEKQESFPREYDHDDGAEGQLDSDQDVAVDEVSARQTEDNSSDIVDTSAMEATSLTEANPSSPKRAFELMFW